jgi:type II restriction/modification system DNA methylase subunit YeeA
VVVANPPYMGSSNMDAWMGKWVKKEYAETYRDLCTCFIDRGFKLSRTDGCSAMVTMQSWMFLSSFEKLRRKILDGHSIATMAHLGTQAFDAIGGEVVSTTATVFRNAKSDVPGAYLRLVDMGSSEEKEKGVLEALADPDCGWFYRRNANSFCAIPGSPIAYWTGDALLAVFRQGIPLGDICDVRKGVTTSDNDRFLHFWWEVSHDKERFECRSVKESVESGAKWFPCNKGGEFRKWYGNNDYVINWENDGYEIRNFRDECGKLLSRPQNTQFYFKSSITWSKISSGSLAFRYKPVGQVFDVAGTSVFAEENQLKYLQGACNSSIILQIANMLSPTLNFEVGQVALYPIIFDDEHQKRVSRIVAEQRTLSRDDWDSSETSWDFKHHPLL